MEKSLSPELKLKIMDIIKENAQFEMENITEDLNIRADLGIDSIQMMSLVADLERELEIEIETQLLTYENFSTVGNIIRIITSKTIPIEEVKNAG